MKRLEMEDVLGEERAEWARLAPEERWRQTAQLWAFYLSVGGSLDPEPDSQSPFFDADEWCASPPDGRSGVRFIRSGGI